MSATKTTHLNNLVLSDDLTVTDDASVGGDLTVTGAINGTVTAVAASANISAITSSMATVDSTSGAVTITCNAAGTAGQKIDFIIKAGPGTNNIVFDPDSFGYFETVTLSATTAIGSVITAISDGAKWSLGQGAAVHS